MLPRKYIAGLLIPATLRLIGVAPPQTAMADTAIFTLAPDQSMTITLNGVPVPVSEASGGISYVYDPPGMYVYGIHNGRDFGGSIGIPTPPQGDSVLYRVAYFDDAAPFLGLVPPLTVSVVGNVATVTDGSPVRTADFNGDGAVSVQDIFDFVCAHLAGVAQASDLHGFLAAWFTSA